MRGKNRTKSLLTFLLASLMVFMLSGCGSSVGGQNESTMKQPQGGNTQTVTEETEPEEVEQTGSVVSDSGAGQTNETENTNSDILVVYFSRTGEQYTVGVIDKGNTAIVAEMIADHVGADMFEILPQEDYYPYTYDELTDVAKKEQNENARPAYQGPAPDLSQYSTIFIGAPVWWGDWPMICYTFFENENLSGKTIIPFSTHEGSGLSGFDRKLSSACPDSEVMDGLAVRGNDAQNKQDSVRDTVNDWLSGLGY